MSPYKCLINVEYFTETVFLFSGNFIFDRCLKQHSSASDLGAVLRESGMKIEDLVVTYFFILIQGPVVQS